VRRAGAVAREAFCAEGRIELRRHPAAEVPADENCLRRSDQATGALEQFTQRRAQFDLEHAGPDDGAGDGGEHRAGLRRRSDLAEPYGAIPAHQREAGERLDVLDERRPAADAALERPRRHERRLRVAADEPVNERGLLAGQEPLRVGNYQYNPMHGALLSQLWVR